MPPIEGPVRGIGEEGAEDVNITITGILHGRFNKQSTKHCMKADLMMCKAKQSVSQMVLHVSWIRQEVNSRFIATALNCSST